MHSHGAHNEAIEELNKSLQLRSNYTLPKIVILVVLLHEQTSRSG